MVKPRKSDIPEWTWCVVVDARTINQFRSVWPTWKVHRPELYNVPLVIICDSQAGDARWWQKQLRFTSDHPDRRLVFWDWPNLDDSQYGDMGQRERMLSAWVKAPPAFVTTPYFLKVDTDVVATETCRWIDKRWFVGGPSIIASPWGYTKSRDTDRPWPMILDDWIEGIPEVRWPNPPLALPEPEPGNIRIRHPRIVSWCCFVSTAFAKLAADYAPGRLPVPSQDTYHWYLAHRRGDGIVRVKMKNYGWDWLNGEQKVRRRAREVLRKAGECYCD
ncbi:MAG: hypothetical protein GY832_24310 [Chloroflexi bacterium]|nr:hypothetical protein [Chloroflexota bacterium]